MATVGLWSFSCVSVLTRPSAPAQRHVDSTNPGRSNLVFRSKPIAEAEMSTRLIECTGVNPRGLGGLRSFRFCGGGYGSWSIHKTLLYHKMYRNMGWQQFPNDLSPVIKPDWRQWWNAHLGLDDFKTSAVQLAGRIALELISSGPS